jgi:DNA-binding transcriptional LysR family regulator
VLPDISIRQLEYLVAVADAPSWSVAAERVGVSASALSQGLAELERRLGVALFEPVGRRRVLRDAALPALEHARQVVALTRDVVTWADRLATARSGTVRLGMIDVSATVHHPEVVARFRSDRPDVRLVMTVAPSGALLDGLRDGALDLVVCVEPLVPVAGVSTTPLLSEPLVVLAPPGSDLDDVPGWGPWVLFPSSSHTRQRIDAALRAAGARVEIAAESHQPDVLTQMVRLGLGWTVLPAPSQVAGVTAGPLVLERRLVLAQRDGAVRDPAVDELADRLRAAPVSRPPSPSPPSRRRRSRRA